MPNCVILVYSLVLIFLLVQQIGRNGVIFGYLFWTLIGCLVSITYLIYCLDCGCQFFFFCENWFRLTFFECSWTVSGDILSAEMSCLVCLVSLLVFLFCIEYIEKERGLFSFVVFFCFFSTCMLVLVCAGNAVQIFFGWEGVGLASFLLINFWHSRMQANKAGLKALLFNRIGDIGLFMSMCLLFICCRTTDITCVTAFLKLKTVVGIHDNMLESFFPYLILLGFVLAAFGKSAQCLLHSWLLDAMEGPTPVSALLHSATMVTAGLYLIIRFNSCFSNSYLLSVSLLGVGMVTAVFGACCAILRFDLKKITAFSTLSQLGLLFCACGVICYSASFYHIICHAFFKALLFVFSGILIFFLMCHDQDIRTLGNVSQSSFLIHIVGLSSLLSLIGYAFFSGFFSKEIILQALLVDTNSIQNVVSIGIILASMLTVVYSSRLFFFVSLRENARKCSSFVSSLESDKMYLTSLLSITIFSTFSVVSGFLLQDIIGPWSFQFSAAISNFVKLCHIVDNSAANYILLFFLFLVQVVFVFIFFFRFVRGYSLNIVIKNSLINRGIILIFFIMSREFLIPLLHYKSTLFYLFVSYSIFVKLVERGLFENMGPMLVWSIIYNCLSKSILWLQQGNLLFYISIGTFIFFSLYFFHFFCLEMLVAVFAFFLQLWKLILTRKN